MDVLIVSNNRSRQPMPVIPYGACIVAQSIQKVGHQVSLLDLMFEPDPVNAVRSFLSGRRPDVIGISVRNLDNNDMQDTVEYVSELVALTDAIGKHSKAPVVLGGSAVGVMPEQLLRTTRAQLAVLGDGEAVFPMLLRALDNGQYLTDALKSIPRVAWMEEGSFRKSPDTLCKLPDELIFPDFQRWIDTKKYRSHLATIPIQSKRGCPFECIYCTYGISEGSEYRLFSPEEVGDIIRRHCAEGMRDIEFVDNVFNSPYDHAMAICENIAEEPSGARLQTIELNPAFIDDNLLKTMHRAGFTGVGVTAESASDKVLKNLEKGYTRDHIWQASEAIKQNPVPCFWLFLIGGPGETKETVRETVQFAQRAARPMDVAFFNIGIRIYPGTPLETIARNEGVLTASPQEMVMPAFYFSPELDLDWVMEELSKVTGANKNFIHGASLSHPWLPAISRFGHFLKVKQPLWKHTRTIRSIVRILGKDIR
ncbi:radical SAM protein [bacterium]|nr:MAG: radical SAM protein [bacterium]